jgi:hypothetical protein
MIKTVILLLATLLCLSGTASAATVYLKDGGTIPCLLARQQGDTVYVLVNRYTEVTLDRSEVSITKTFKGKKAIGSSRHLRKKLRHKH